MQAEPDPKKAAEKCFEAIGLDPDSYRIGHTKARIYPFLFYICSPIVSSLSNRVKYLHYEKPNVTRHTSQCRFTFRP